MALFDDDYLVSDSGAAPPASPLIMPGEPGIGLSPAMDPRSAAVGRMSAPQKMFSVLGEVGAALQGRPSPLDAQVRQERSDKLQKLQETKIHNDLLEDSVKLLKQMHGPERQAFARARAAQLNGISPGLGDSLVGLSEESDILKRMGKIAEIPAVQIARRAGGEEAVLRLVSSPTFWKDVAQPHFDDKAAPLIVDKVAALKRQYAILHPEEYKAMEKDGFTHSEIMRINDEFATRQDKFSGMALTNDEKQTLSRKEKFVYRALGIIGSASEAKADEQRLIDAGKKGPATDVARLIAERDALPEDSKERKTYDAMIAKLTTHQPTTNVTVGAPVAGVDDKGNPVFFQPDKKGGEPKIVPGVKPPPKAKTGLAKLEEDLGMKPGALLSKGKGGPDNKAQLINEAKRAITAGADRAAVIKRLKEMGVTNHGL